MDWYVKKKKMKIKVLGIQRAEEEEVVGNVRGRGNEGKAGQMIWVFRAG